MKVFALTGLFLLLLPNFSLAAPPSDQAAAASKQYQQAVSHLTDGHFFESAIAELQTAVRLEPTNSDYHLALGCAEVSRAGSLAYAAWATDQFENDHYYGAIPLWEQGQKDPHSPWYGLPRPVLPKPHFQTKDDLKTLRLTGRQAAAQVITLGQAAQGEWKRGVALASTPALRAQAESIQGWGLLYERILLESTGYPESKVPDAPKPAQVIAAFQAATKDDPSHAAYWEGLGYAYENAPQGDTLSPDIARADQEALSLSPGNIGLRYHLYLLQCHDLSQVKSDRKTPAETLRPLADAAPGNAFLQYALAAVLFKQAQEYDNFHSNVGPGLVPVLVAQVDTEANRRLAQEALVAIERGNTAPDYEAPKYFPPVPRILTQAWRYWYRGDPNRLNQMALVRSAARGVAGYAQIAAQRGDTAEAVRAAQDCDGWGRRMMEGPGVEQDATRARDDSGLSPVVRQDLGCAISMIGLTELKRVYEQAGDGSGAQATAEKLAAMKARHKVLMDAIYQELATPKHEYDDY